jgi:PAS domain S-box-containing protein
VNDERDELRQPSAQPAAAAAATARELQEARDALHLANARMENMLESLTDGFCGVDHHWRIMYINGRALDMLAPLQKTRPSLIGHDLWASFPELRGSMLETVYRRAMVSRETAIQEFFWPALKRWFEVRAHPSPDGLTLYFQDINRRKADQQALQQGNSRLQVALAAGRLGDWRWDAASDRVMLGERAAAIFGLPAEQPLAWSELRARLDPGDRESVRRAVLQAFAGHSDLELECRLPGPAGEPRWVALVGRADYADQARREGVLGMTGVVQDITARRSAADALRQSEEVLRALANTIPQLAWMAQADGAIVWFNERWFDYTGTTPDQVVGWGWQTTVEPTVLPAVLERWNASIKSGNPFEMEYPIRGADGMFRWFLTRVSPVRDRHGKVLRWFGTNTDVDEVKRAEQALRDESHVLELLNATGSALASTRDLRSLLQAATDAATGIAGARQGAFLYHGRNDGIEADANNLFTLYTVSGGSPVGFEAFGEAGPNGLFGPGLLDHPAGVVRSGDVTLDARLHGGTPFGLPTGLPAGHPVVRSYLAVPVVGHSGELLGTMFFGHPEPDIFSERTERIVRGIAAQAAVAIDNVRLYEAAQRAAEERKVLLESERQARAEAERTSQMKDEFLATLSHELRTPLSAILGWAQVLRRGSRDQNDLQKGLQTIERNARAQAQLIEDLLDMSRITSGNVLLDTQAVAPASFIDAAIETVRPAADAKNIRIEKHYGADPGLVAGDPARLQQVVWNLLSNAIKFTPRDGLVSIELARSDANVAITVRDNGMGIRPEFITHVFERFRQADASMTRRHGGLGLGLAIVKHLIEQHGGTVRAESAGEGKGASFTIELPLAKQQQPATRSARSAMILPTPATPEMTVLDLSGVNVLVVDDDRDARELIKRILSDCGASVRIAASARDAFALFRERAPDLLISDLGMPEVDGFELLDWVRHLGREEGGQVPAIALTAFARSEDRLSALEAGFSAHISKPVEPSELIATVASVVGPSSPLANRASASIAGRNGVR